MDDLDASASPVVAAEHEGSEPVVPAHFLVEGETAGAFAGQDVGG